jgi:hypothetical protein
MAQMRLIIVMTMLSYGCSSDGGDDNDSNHGNGNGPIGSVDYLVETVTIDASSGTVEIIGLFSPDAEAEACSLLPVAEIHHRFVWPDQFTKYRRLPVFSYSQITRDEYDERGAAIPFVWEREFNFAPWGKLMIMQMYSDPIWLGSLVQKYKHVFFEITTADGTVTTAASLELGSCGEDLCGDGLCGGGETNVACPEDCGCGNGVLEPPEVCDARAFGGLTCEDFGLSGGERLSCDLDDCASIDTSYCIQ